MGVSTDESGDPPVKVPAEGHFFAGGLAVDVEEDDFGLGFAVDLGQELVGFAEGVVAGGHEDAALKVDDGVALASRQLALIDTEARSANSVVGRAQDAAAANVGFGGDGHVLEDLALVPDVVAGGDDMGAEVEEFFCDGGGDAEAAGGVFAVDDEEVDGVGFKDVRKVFADDVAPSGAENIADKEDIH